MVPDEYQDCDPPIFKSKNEIINTNETLDYLETCYIEELGGQYYELVKQVYVTCRILDDIDCCGDRSFYRKGSISHEFHILTACFSSLHTTQAQPGKREMQVLLSNHRDIVDFSGFGWRRSLLPGPYGFWNWEIIHPWWARSLVAC